MFNWFFRKKEVEEIKNDTKKGFDLVKKDIDHVGKWIRHLNSEKDFHKKDIEEIKEILSSVQEDLEELKNMVFLNQKLKPNRLFKTAVGVLGKQTAVGGVQTAVQTAVQTPFFDQFSTMERSTIWILLNTDMKLSYEDIAAILGKEKATIRGQINTIKQKSEGLIFEIVESNGKKRIFIPEEIKEKLLKKQKVSIKRKKKAQKNR